jgi:hypothetical protein
LCPAAWILHGTIRKVDIVVLEELYEDMFGTELSQVSAEHDIVFSDLELSIGTFGLLFEGQVTVHGYTSVSATISISSVGVEIKGCVSDVDLDIVKIENAALDVFIGPAGQTGRPYRVSINGDVKVDNVEFKAALYLGKSTEKNLNWTVYGEIDNVVLSKFAPDIKDSYLDLDLKRVALIASNMDQPMEQVPNQWKYPVKKGTR